MGDGDGRPVMLVTGASLGVGAAVARLAAARGRDVLLTCLGREDAALASAEACRATGARREAVRADAGTEDRARDASAALDARFGRMDALVNNAGVVGAPGCLADTPPKVRERVFRLNVLGAAAHAPTSPARR